MKEIIKHPNLGKDSNLTMEALKESYFASESKWLSQAKEKKWEDGSTALCALVLNNVLFVANTGDCRALMCKGGTNVTLTRDHKPDEPEERSRIESRGGSIIGGRVQGQLGVSRSFGDYLYKDKENLIENYLNCEPEISSYILTPDTDFIVIGCDGLYEEMSNEDIVKFVKTRIEEKKNISEICKELVLEAIERGSKDNVSAIILKFDKYFKKKLHMAMKLKDKVSLNKTTEIRKESHASDQLHLDETKLKPFKRNTTSSKSRSGSEDHKSYSTTNESPSSDESQTQGKAKRSNSIEPSNSKVKNNKQEQKSNPESVKRALPASLSCEIQNYKREKSTSVDIERKKVTNPLTNSVNNISNKKSKEKPQSEKEVTLKKKK